VTESFKRHFLKDKEMKQLLAEILQKTKIDIKVLFNTDLRIEFAESKNVTLYLINNKPLLTRKDNMILPTLAFDDILKSLPQVVVNMGAVPHVCNGADVMAPGIVAVKGDFGKDSFVVVVDERHQKPLAVGTTLYDSAALRNLKRGKTIKNVHWIGDDLWQTLRKL
jgi:PUA-domain protein